jgi:maleylacetoacetate isomerase
MNQNQMTLYHYWRSSCSWRVRWALAIKKLPYHSVPVNLLKGEHQTPDFLKINPLGSVPAIVIGNDSFTQSLAIIEWLDEKYPSNPLLPSSGMDRLKVREMSLVIAADTQPLQNLAPQQYFSSEASRRAEYARHWIGRGLRSYEKHANRVAGSFSFGDSVTMADLCLIPQVYNALRFGTDFSEFPTIRRIYNLAITRAECIAASPGNQPGADTDSSLKRID